MRHKYDTRGIVFGRTSAGETNALVSILTKEFGLVRARAQGLRRPGAKLASALTTLSESDIALVRGKEGWRLTGAVQVRPWFRELPDADARERAGRVMALIARLVAGEAPEEALYPVYLAYLEALARAPIGARDSAEVLAALYVLAALGLDDLPIPTPPMLFADDVLARAAKDRSGYVARVNRGIAASGL